MKHYLLKITLCLLFIFTSISSYNLYNLENFKRSLKKDLIELSDIKYGLFNVDKWKDQLATIIINRLEELNLKGKDREVAEKKIKKLLYEVIENFEISYKRQNRENSFFGISYKNIGADVFNIFGRLKQHVPEITDQIINFLEKEENRESIKDYILLQLDKYRNSTFQKVDYEQFNLILSKYRTDNKNDCSIIIKNSIRNYNKQINSFLVVTFICYMVILLYTLLSKEHSTFNFVIFIITALQFLLLGVLLPMIDIDARIGIMEFELIGETISFKDQVLYFKSKSIVEMSKLMLSQEKFEVTVVGILVVTFSIIFPLLKIISSLGLMFHGQLVNNKMISFLVFKSGKWSMADVMVVAIFMSYIGFTGIISSQLNQLEKISKSLNILTTNNSELQHGFYFFLGFVILSISISQSITNLYKESLNYN